MYGNPARAAGEETRNRARSLALWLLPSFGSYLFVGALLVTVFVAGDRLFLHDSDAGWHIRLGLGMLETGRIPVVDRLSHTMAGRPVVAYEWLSEVLYAAAYRVAGLAGAALLAGLLIATATWLVYRLCRRLGVAGPLALGFGALAFRLEALHLVPRPHLFTLVLVGVLMWWLLEFRRDGNTRRLWPVPLLMLAWANLHGGFLVGIALLALFAFDAGIDLVLRSGELDRRTAQTRFRALLATAGLAVAATLLNPAGFGLWSHSLGLLGSRLLIELTQEFGAPDFHSAAMAPFLAAILLGYVLAFGGKARPQRLHVLLYLAMTAAGLYSARYVTIFGVAAVPVLALWTQSTIDGLAQTEGSWVGRRARRFRAWMERMSRIDAAAARRPLFAAAGAALSVWWVLGPGRPLFAFPAANYPVQALRQLDGKLPSGRIFNDFLWGGYLALERPDIPVFIDGETDLFGPGLVEQYLMATGAGPGWQGVLDAHRVDWTLTRSSDPINQVLALSRGWSLVYRDQLATVYRRAPAPVPGEGGGE